MKTILLFISYLMYFVCTAQCIADGPRNANTFANNTSTGSVAWASATNASTSDNSRATAGSVVGILSSVTTNYLVATNFGFNIPSTAIICGIEIDIERRAQGLLVGSSIIDNNVRIVKSGAITGLNHALGINWPAPDSYTTLGNNIDAWGTTWTPAEINAADFGIAYSTRLNAGLAALFLSAEIDHIQLSVYYEIPLPVTLLNFDGNRAENNLVNLNWTTSSEINNDFFTVERSSDAINWEERQTVTGAGNSQNEQYYTFTDVNPLTTTSYYRLKQTDYNGTATYHKTIAIEPNLNETASVSIYPNPSNGILTLTANSNITKIEVYNVLGKLIYSSQHQTTETTIDLSNYPKEIYLIKTYINQQVTNSKIVLN